MNYSQSSTCHMYNRLLSNTIHYTVLLLRSCYPILIDLRLHLMKRKVRLYCI